MSIQIHADNSISLDGVAVGLSVIQRSSGTVVYTPESVNAGTKYAEHKMPHPRYSLAHDRPASGAAGKAEFEADIRAMLSR